MQKNFDQSFKWLMEHEGGFTDDSSLGDSGGMTCWGVTHHDWAKWIGKEPTRAQMKALKQSDVKPLYKAYYWDILKCDQLPSGLDYAIFDYGVNSGIYRAAKILQRLLGVTVDGIIGKETLKAVKDKDGTVLALKVCDERLGFLRSLRIFRNFGRGWTARVNEVRARVLEMK